MTTAQAPVSAGSRRYYRSLAGVFLALAMFDLFVLDLHERRNIAQLLLHVALPLLFIAFQLDPRNRLRTPLAVLASVALIGNAIYMFGSMAGYFG